MTTPTPFDKAEFIELVTGRAAEVYGRDWLEKDLISHSNDMIGKSQINRILDLSRPDRPGTRACHGLANALNLPPETIMRWAGWLPPVGTEAHRQGLTADLASLSEEERLEVLERARELAGSPGESVRRVPEARAT